MQQITRTPQERADATLGALIHWQENRYKPMGTPLIFWTIRDRFVDGQGSGCSNAVDICLLLYGEAAGTLATPAPIKDKRPVLVHQADEEAVRAFYARVAWAVGTGYVATEETLSADRLRWVGHRKSGLPHEGVITCVVEAVRGSARPDDEAVLALAARLRERRPPLPTPACTGKIAPGR